MHSIAIIKRTDMTFPRFLFGRRCDQGYTESGDLASVRGGHAFQAGAAHHRDRRYRL
jgi:hypothetical protein